MARHIQIFVDKMDCIVSCLGPDMESLLFEELKDLGRRHWQHYGVHAHDLPHMISAILFALDHVLGPCFATTTVRDDWNSVLQGMAKIMVQGMTKT